MPAAKLSTPSRGSHVTEPHVTMSLSVGRVTPTSAVVEISVHGSWSRNLGMDVSAALRDCFAGRPDVVIIDLHGMADDGAASLPLWLATKRVTDVLRPPVRLALCMPTATVLQERLRRIGAHRLPIYHTMIEARSAMTNTPNV